MNMLTRVFAALQNAWRTLSPSCREVSRLQSAALDHSLSRGERLGLRLHLLLCKWCRRYGQQIRFLRRAVREHPDELHDPPARALSPEARERLKQTLRDEQR